LRKARSQGARGRGLIAVAWLAVVIVAIAVGAVVRLGAFGGFAAGGPRPAAAKARSSILALPPAAQAAISRALGRELRAYRVRAVVGGYVARTVDQRLRSSFTARGVTVADGGIAVSLALRAVGSQRLARAVVPRLVGGRVVYRYGSVREWFANGPLGVEQGFTVSSRQPRSTGGTLTLTLGLTGSLRSSLSGGDVLLRRHSASLRYDDLHAVDARGRPLRAWLSLRSGTIVVHVVDRGARFPLTIDPLVQAAELTPSAATEDASDDFGQSVAVSGDTVVVGETAGATPAAYVFQAPGGFGGADWSTATLVATLTAVNTTGTEPVDAGSFAASVAISPDGKTIVVGAPSSSVGSNGGEGAAYVYSEPTDGTWASGSQSAVLTPSNGVVDGAFGTAVAANDNTIVVGAPPSNQRPTTQEATGEVYVYAQPSNGIWATKNQTAGLLGVSGRAQLGTSVAISADGTLIVAGAPGGGTNGSGEVEVYYLSGADWASGTPSMTTLMQSGGNSAGGDALGTSVVISPDGNVIAAGAPGYDVGSNDAQGAVYVWFETVNGPPSAELVNGSGAAGDNLGQTVALLDDFVVVAGAPGSAGGAGSAYEFDAPGYYWDGNQDSGTELGSGDGFGTSLAGDAPSIGGGPADVVVGAPSANNSYGAAYVFATPTSTALVSSSNPSTAGRDVTFTATVSPTPFYGTLSFTDNGSAVSGCTNLTLQGDTATCAIDFGSTGDYPIEASYSGDGAYAPSQSTTVEAVNIGPTSTALASSPTAPITGQPVTYTATVSPTPDGGTVDFTDNGTTIAGCGVEALTAGTATCTTSAGALNASESIVATYSGDADYLGSTSSALSQTVEGALLGISVENSPGPGADAYGLPMTPQFLQRGSTVLLQLPPLPAGTTVSTVEFGILDGTAVPSSVDLANGTVTAVLPTFATSGTVTVATSVGDFVGPLDVDNFRDVWGLPFVNYGMPPGYVNTQAAVAIFGQSQVYNALGIETPAAKAWIANSQSFEGGGMCYGFTSFTQAAWALKVAHDVNLADNYPNTGDTPYDVDSAGSPSVAAYQAVATGEISQNVPAFYDYLASQTAESTSIPAQRTVDELLADWQAMRSGSASAAKDLPFIVLFNQGTGGGGHAVVPYDIEPDGSGYAIDVFNENDPYSPSELSGDRGIDHVEQVEESRIVVSADGSWLFPQFSPTWEGDKYHMYVQTLGNVYNPLYPDGLSNPTLIDTDSDLGITVPGPFGLFQVIDSHGRRLINSNGTQNTNASSDIPGATLGNELTSGATPGPRQAVLPPGGSYTVTLAGASTAQLTGNGLDATVQLGAQPGAHDRIGVTAQQGQLTIAAGGDHGTPLAVNMVTGSTTQDSLDLTTTAVPGATDEVTFRDGTVTVHETGAGRPVTISLSTLSQTGLPEAGSFGPIALSAGQTLALIPKSGAGYGQANVTVSGRGAVGHRTLRSTTRALAKPATPKVAVARGAGGSWLLTIRARPGVRRAGVKLTLVWIVRRGGKVVSQHELALTERHLPRTVSDRFSTARLGNGRYTFTGEVVAERDHGVVEQAVAAEASHNFQVG
jgi:Bacterial Ig-like domain (group 3)/FG-GAP repeat